MRHPLLTFNSGELSPLVDARSDVDKYRAGCRILENMIPRIYGTAERRPGTKYIDTCNGVSRVIPFIYSSEIAYIILMEDLRFWFYFDGGRVLDGSGRRLGIDTPYLAADLFEIQYKQSNDVMWLTHKSYAQRKLSRTSASAFSLDEIVFTQGPFQKRNDLAFGDDITLQPSVTTGDGTLTASGNVFDVGHVGALFALYQPRVNKEISGDLTAPNTGIIGGTLLVEGSFTFQTDGIWTGTVELQRSIDGVIWETFYSISSSASRNALETWEEEETGILYRVNVTELTANTATGTTGTPSKVEVKLTVNSSLQRGICRVTSYSSATSVGMTVLKDFASTDADVRWQEGCWSTYRGFPACVTFYGDRCVYARTNHQPQTVWFSKVDDFNNFDECTKDDSAFSLTMNSDTRNEIRWISALEGLLVGTSGGEWLIRSSRFDEPLTPSNFTFKQQTSYGSAAIQALPTNDVVLFVDFVRRKVRELTYNGQAEKYVAPDLTALAEHVTKSGIIEIAFQKNPDPILWCVRFDGTLISMTYEREQNVVAWARHPFDVGEGVTAEIPAIPAVAPTYNYSYFAENGYVWGIPVGDAQLYTSLDADGAAVDIGGGLAGLPYAGHPFVAGETIHISGSISYDGQYVLDATTTENQLVVPKLVFAAETFTGNEVVVKVIPGLSVGAGRLVRDTTGVLYYGGSEVGASSVVTKILTDNTLVNDFLNWIDPPTGASVVLGMAISSDDQYLYVMIQYPFSIAKFDLDTGDAVWQTAASQSYDCAIDSDGNAYNQIGTNINKFDSDTGTAIALDRMGDTAYPSDILGGLYYCCITDNGHGIVAAGGAMYCLTASGSTIINSMYNLGVRTYDGVTGAQMCVGNTYVDGALTYTPQINTGGIVMYEDYLYVLITREDTIYKILWDGSNLTEIATVSVPADTRMIYFDPWGNLVAVRADGVNTDMFKYYDKNLTPIVTLDNFYQTMFNTWRASAWIVGNAAPDGTLGSPAVPAVPGTTIEGLGPNSVAVIPSTDEDEVWLVVSRILNGSHVRYIEQMQPRQVDDQEDMWFADSALDYDGTATDSFSGLDHLEGQEVVVLGDGAVYDRETVANGSIALSESASRVISGLPFRYTLKPMRFDLTVDGTTKGSLKRFTEVVLSFYRSLNVTYGVDTDNLFNIDFRTEEAYGSPPALYTGDKVAAHEGGYDPEDSIIVTGDAPLPCVLRALVPRINSIGR